MAISDYTTLYERVRAYTGYSISDIADATLKIYLDDGYDILEFELGREYVDGSHDAYVISLYGCGLAVNFINGPSVKKIEVSDTKLEFNVNKLGSPSGGIASNDFLEAFWSELGLLETGGGLEKSTWNLEDWKPDYDKNIKRYGRIDKSNYLNGGTSIGINSECDCD